ncbi:MAG: hypothetical protein R3346_01325 [Candidatus Spechtbacterales bacterium]|nr:hypothetical protein [Candidatus Spechtbacterales bacterium]
MNIRKEARLVLLKNFHGTKGRYITPATEHYKSQWFWDSCFHAISCSELGMYDMAKKEITQLLKHQDERGFIPHLIFHGIYDWYDVERYLYGKGRRPTSSSIVGQAVLAQAVEAIDDDEFTNAVIEQVVAFYKFFVTYRDAENVLSIISPREGRDASPEYDFFRPHAPKFLNILNRILDPLYTHILEWKYLRMGWNEKKILASNIFHVKDLVAHCIWLDGLYSLRRLLKKIERENLFPDIDEVIERGVNSLIENCWDEETKTFYPIRVGYGKINQVTLGTLFPLLIEDLPKEIELSIIEKLTDPKIFWTPYPIPSVPRNHPEYNPGSSYPLWRGQSWICINWFIIKALAAKGYKDIARELAEKSTKMVEMSGFNECYNPETGAPLRVKNLAWSTLVVTFPKLVS